MRTILSHLRTKARVLSFPVRSPYRRYIDEERTIWLTEDHCYFDAKKACRLMGIKPSEENKGRLFDALAGRMFSEHDIPAHHCHYAP